MPLYMNGSKIAESGTRTEFNGTAIDEAYFNGELVYSYWNQASLDGVTEFPSDENQEDIVSGVDEFTNLQATFTDVNGNTSDGNLLTSTVVVDSVSVVLSDIFYNDGSSFKYHSYYDNGVDKYCLKVKHNGLPFSIPSKATWTKSYGSCADQDGGASYTYPSSDKSVFKYYGEFTTDGNLPKKQYPKYSVSNNGRLHYSASGNDANNISQTIFTWSFMGKTYKLYNQTKNRSLYVKDYGEDDSKYTITGVRNFTSASGYIYMRVAVGGSSTVDIGNADGYLDLSQMQDIVKYDGSNILKPEYWYARNFHYAACTYSYVYPLEFTEV